MPTLTVHCGNATREIAFEGTPKLSQLLEAPPHPCGGRGACGKCAVQISGAVSAPTPAEVRAGTRLSCQIVLFGDAQVVLNDAPLEQIETASAAPISVAPMCGRLGAAVDVGTTSIALQLYDLASGACLAECGRLNPQTSVAADVIGRIDAALHGALDALKSKVRAAIVSMIEEACQICQRSPEEVDALVIAGNTTMLYLLAGRNPESLSHAPFAADCLFGATEVLQGRACYLPPCMNAFVGADITCAVLSCELLAQEKPTLLCDIGTNGEIALWAHGKLFVTSTAAGPAFEGTGIQCGCLSVRGAIDRAWAEDGRIRFHTIGDVAPVGICGSGLMDVVAAALSLALIDETGAMEGDCIELAPGIQLTQRDVRAVQLAKAAIAAGIDTLLEMAELTAEQVDALWIAGGFGSHLNIESAARIGLIPEAMAKRTKILGNAALAGTAQMLLDQEQAAEAQRIAAMAQHVNLGGNAKFNERYVEQMFFPEG